MRCCRLGLHCIEHIVCGSVSAELLLEWCLLCIVLLLLLHGILLLLLLMLCVLHTPRPAAKLVANRLWRLDLRVDGREVGSLGEAVLRWQA